MPVAALALFNPATLAALTAAAEYAAVATAGALVAVGVWEGGKAISNQMSKADDDAKAKTKDVATTDTCKDCPCKRTVGISKSASPQAAQHILDAQAAGHPSKLTYSPAGALARSRAALSGIPTMPGMDRDEYPPKVFAEGGAGASVRHIPFADNRSAGGQMASQLAGATEGCEVTIKVVP